jgi:flavorubredoxin
MVAREIRPGVYSLSTIDWDRRLFDELIPLPHGTSYNAYLIRGNEKTALIDTTHPSMKEELFQDLKKLDVKKVDYVIANHAEPDHSGTIPDVVEEHSAVVLASEKCKQFLVDKLHLEPDKIRTVKDGEEISLGNRTLRFIEAPWVHWPETILTYLKEEKILFPCDLFGSHLATSDLQVMDEGLVRTAAKRYYAEIMMPFRPIIRVHLEKIRKLEIEMIAPSHGPVYQKPEFILDLYEDWTSDDVKNEAIIAYVSMYGSTLMLVDHLTEELIKRGITVKRYDLVKSDVGELAMSLVDAATIVLASPTVLGGAHPAAVYGAYLIKILKPKAKFVGVIGSYGWGTRIVEQAAELLKSLRVEILKPILVKGEPNAEDLKKISELAEEIARKHERIGAKNA